jgi:hypothetical protein
MEGAMRYLLTMLVLFAASTAHARDLTDAEKQMFMDAVKERLKDPDSAQFRWMPMRDPPKEEMYCGMVNAKNSYGGYSGFSPFQAMLIGEPHKAAIVISMGNSDARVTASLCADNGYGDLDAAR